MNRIICHFGWFGAIRRSSAWIQTPTLLICALSWSSRWVAKLNEGYDDGEAAEEGPSRRNDRGPVHVVTGAEAYRSARTLGADLSETI
jgi:hypothetical protein